MSAQKPTKRQHYVQRAYLTHFASPDKNDNGGIWTYDKKGNSPRLQASIHSGLEKDIYTLKHSKAVAPDILETAVFTPIENIGYPVLKKLASDDKYKSLDAEDIGRLSGYLVAAHLRVPRNIDATKQLMEGVLVESLKRMSKDPEKIKTAWESAQKKFTSEVLPKGEIKDLLENPEKHVRIKADSQIALLLNMKLFDEVGRILLAMSWSLCDAPKDSFFVVGDSPLIVLAPMGPGRVIFGGGFALPQVQIHFPISPKRCLFLTHGNNPPHIKLSKGAVDEVNRRSIAMSERFVFAPYRSNNIQKLVEKFTSAGKKIDRTRLAQKIDEWEIKGKSKD